MFLFKGLSIGYRHHHNTHKVIGWLWGISLLPHSMIEDAYKFVCDNSADTYKNLLTYFRDQWLSGPFDRKSWSVHKEEFRTNNSIEGRPNTERNSSYTG